MTRARRQLVLAALGGLGCATLGAAVAIRERLPAEFGGFLRGGDVARDFVTLKGTALSAPLVMLVVQAACIASATREGWGGRVSVIGLTVIGAAEVIGQLGEPVLYRSTRPAAFRPARAAVLVGNLMLPSLMVALGVRAWRVEARGRADTPAQTGDAPGRIG